MDVPKNTASEVLGVRNENRAKQPSTLRNERGVNGHARSSPPPLGSYYPALRPACLLPFMRAKPRFRRAEIPTRDAPSTPPRPGSPKFGRQHPAWSHRRGRWWMRYAYPPYKTGAAVGWIRRAAQCSGRGTSVVRAASTRSRTRSSNLELLAAPAELPGVGRVKVPLTA